MSLNGDAMNNYHKELINEIALIGAHNISFSELSADPRYDEHFICKFQSSYKSIHVSFGLYRYANSRQFALKVIGLPTGSGYSQQKIIHISNCMSLENDSDRLASDLDSIIELRAILRNQSAFHRLVNRSFAKIYNFYISLDENSSKDLNFKPTHTLSLIVNHAIKLNQIFIYPVAN